MQAPGSVVCRADGAGEGCWGAGGTTCRLVAGVWTLTPPATPSPLNADPCSALCGQGCDHACARSCEVGWMLPLGGDVLLL